MAGGTPISGNSYMREYRMAKFSIVMFDIQYPYPFIIVDIAIQNGDFPSLCLIYPFIVDIAIKKGDFPSLCLIYPFIVIAIKNGDCP